MKRMLSILVCICLLLANSISVCAMEINSSITDDMGQGKGEQQTSTEDPEMKSDEEIEDKEPAKEEGGTQKNEEQVNKYEEESELEEENEEIKDKENKVTQSEDVSKEEKEGVILGNTENNERENEEILSEKTENCEDNEIENVEDPQENLQGCSDKESEIAIVNENVLEDKNKDNTPGIDDPQNGRANGFVDEAFFDSSFYSRSTEYIHNDKFDDYEIKDVIDVSYYQGNIDWNRVKASGIDYAFIRAGYRGYGTEGTLNIDKNFSDNMRNAIAADIQVGVYFFSQAVNEKEALEEANYVLDLIEGYDFLLPVVIDFEYAFSAEGLCGRLYNANLSNDKATKVCITFCDAMKENGYDAMVYANKDMLENRLNASEISKDYKIWLANYTTSTAYSGKYDFWQYTQNGKVDGIATNVDKNFWYINKSVKNGIDYSLVYDFNYYLEHNEDVRVAYGHDEDAVLEHFVEWGIKEGRQGNEKFNVYTYKNRYTDLRNAYGNDLEKYYMHYINYGYAEGRNAEGVSDVQGSVTVFEGEDYSLVYDYDFYTENYSDIKSIYGNDDIAILEYFVACGMTKGQQGCKDFNVYTYKNRYADLRRVYGKDLSQYYMHYIDYGYAEGRNGDGISGIMNSETVYEDRDYSLVYNFEYYINTYEDIKNAYEDDEKAALEHFVKWGMAEGRQARENFNVYTYKNRYADLRRIYGKDLIKYYMHYIDYGYAEGRSGDGISEVVDPVTVYEGIDYVLVYDYYYYIKKYGDVKNAYGSDDKAVLEHFIKWGMSEGRQAKASFDVYTYRERYRDVKNAYGNNLRLYYMHYINCGKVEGRSGENIGKISLIKITSGSQDEIELKITIELEDVSHKYEEYYVVETSLCDASIKKVLETRKIISGVDTFNIGVSGREQVESLIMDGIAIAIKDEKGNFIYASGSVMISNPEALAQNTTPIFKGTSKKGLQGVYYASDSDKAQPADARYTNTKQTLINLDLSTVVSKTPKSGYISYSYKGNTYYFSDLEDLKTNIKSLNFGYKQYLYGNSGRTPVAVSLCLLLRYNEENSFLIDPAARTYIKDKYYTLNVREEYARETLEALFFYLGETFGQSDCYVSNWILGNEINSSKAWNYSGSLDFDTYMECYATAFRMLYTAVKSEKTGNTVSVSLDNGWTAAPDTYAGKVTLDTFAKKIHAQNPNIDWSIAYHPYSYPLTRGDFWNDYSNTTDNISTPYISMRNINVLTNYAGTLESTYGKKSGSIRILLTEQGYSYAAGKEVQAQAIARGYYIAEFNDRIDAFIIRAIVDDEDEAKGKLYFGLMNSQQDKRISYYVYEHMDSDLSRLAQQSAEGYVTEDNYTNFNNAKSILCNTNWNAIVPGFNAAKLAGIK